MFWLLFFKVVQLKVLFKGEKNLKYIYINIIIGVVICFNFILKNFQSFIKLLLRKLMLKQVGVIFYSYDLMRLGGVYWNLLY